MKATRAKLKNKKANRVYNLEAAIFDRKHFHCYGNERRSEGKCVVRGRDSSVRFVACFQLSDI